MKLSTYPVRLMLRGGAVYTAQIRATSERAATLKAMRRFDVIQILNSEEY